MNPIIVLGRGQSGTRVIAKTLHNSGVSMGRWVSPDSFDTLPPEHMYSCARMGADYGPPPEEYRFALSAYVANIERHPGVRWGWKLPETVLSFSWLRQVYPNAWYIHWRRDPRDALRNAHITDDLNQWGVKCDAVTIEGKRIASWVYHEEIVRESLVKQGVPRNWIEIRFEDFILNQGRELLKLEAFLGMPLARVPVDVNAVGRPLPFPFPIELSRKYGYV
jgi:hypothetical protein